MQTIRQGIGAFDADFRLVLWNPQFLDLLALPADMMRVGLSLEEIVRFNESRGEYGRQGEFETLLARRQDRARGGGRMSTSAGARTAPCWRSPRRRCRAAASSPSIPT